MKELELKALNELTEVYEKYFYEGLTKNVQAHAKDIYDQYMPANTMLDENVNVAVGKLFPVAYPDSGSETPLPSKEEAKSIIIVLEKLRVNIDDIEST